MWGPKIVGHAFRFWRTRRDLGPGHQPGHRRASARRPRCGRPHSRQPSAARHARAPNSRFVRRRHPASTHAPWRRAFLSTRRETLRRISMTGRGVASVARHGFCWQYLWPCLYALVQPLCCCFSLTITMRSFRFCGTPLLQWQQTWRLQLSSMQPHHRLPRLRRARHRRPCLRRPLHHQGRHRRSRMHRRSLHHCPQLRRRQRSRPRQGHRLHRHRRHHRLLHRRRIFLRRSFPR